MVVVKKGLIVLAALVAIAIGGLKASGYLASGYLASAPAAVAAAAVAGDLQVSGPTPRRIVSVVPSLTEMLYAIGAGPQVVGVSSYDAFPPEATRLPRVGALLDPDVERILSLRPDLVLTYGSQTTLEAQMARSGIKVFSYRHGGIDGILQGLRNLGVVTGRAVEGERTARELRQRLDAISARVRAYARPRVLLVFGRQPQSLQQMYVSGGAGFLSDLLEVAGAANVFADVPRESVQPSQETLLTRAPEVIVELRSGNPPTATQMTAERRAWAPLASIPAVRNNHIHVLTADYYFVPGPRVAMAAEGLARTLHPEAFR
jgi:iron complex transport system substrate-binding protein